MFLRAMTIALVASTFAVSLCDDGMTFKTRKVSTRVARATSPKVTDIAGIAAPDAALKVVTPRQYLLAVLTSVDSEDGLDIETQTEADDSPIADSSYFAPTPKSTVPEPAGIVAIALGVCGFVRIRKR